MIPVYVFGFSSLHAVMRGRLVSPFVRLFVSAGSRHTESVVEDNVKQICSQHVRLATICVTSSLQSHPGHLPHPAHPGHLTQPVHPGHLTHQAHPGYLTHLTSPKSPQPRQPIHPKSFRPVHPPQVIHASPSTPSHPRQPHACGLAVVVKEPEEHGVNHPTPQR